MRKIIVLILLYSWPLLAFYRWDVSIYPEEPEKTLLLSFSSDEKDAVDRGSFLKKNRDGAYEVIGEFTGSSWSLKDISEDRESCYFVRLFLSDGGVTDLETLCRTPHAPLLNGGRWGVLILLAVAFALFILIPFFSSFRPVPESVKRKFEDFRRHVEAVSESGRYTLFVPGTEELDNPQSMASVPIVAGVAKSLSANRNQLLVGCSKSLVFAASERACEQALPGEKRIYGDVHYVADDPFAFSVSINGVVSRDKPHLILFAGAFYAESLLLSEPGMWRGVDQVSGTANLTQIPFFLVSSAKTLMGEELFAISAACSENRMTGSQLYAVDRLKIIILTVIVLFSLAASIIEYSGGGDLKQRILQMFQESSDG